MIARLFKYFETVSSDDLKGYIKERMSGSDGDQAWSVRSVEKNLGFVKVYWNWCLDNDLITTSNVIDLPRQMQRKNNTKSQRKKTKKSANLAYTVEQAWLLHSSAKEENEKLADLILLGMYTGCRIGEVTGCCWKMFI